MDATGAHLDQAELSRLHAMKTGALIRAAVRMGAMVGGADAETLARLDKFAGSLGLAFQIRDDILDVEASAEQLGKTAGKDAAQGKATFVSLLGRDGAERLLAELAHRMHAELSSLDEGADALRALARFAVNRVH
jgi:farnesyl diphosphate synthase